MNFSPAAFTTTIELSLIISVSSSISWVKRALKLAWKFDINIAAEIPLPETSAIQNPVFFSESLIQS